MTWNHRQKLRPDPNWIRYFEFAAGRKRYEIQQEARWLAENEVSEDGDLMAIEWLSVEEDTWACEINHFFQQTFPLLYPAHFLGNWFSEKIQRMPDEARMNQFERIEHSTYDHLYGSIEKKLFIIAGMLVYKSLLLLTSVIVVQNIM